MKDCGLSNRVVSVISLGDEAVVSSVFRNVRHSTAGHQHLRRQIFREVAKNTKLQHCFLEVLSRHPDVQKAVLQELVKNPRLKRKFIVAAYKTANSPVTPGSPKTRNS